MTTILLLAACAVGLLANVLNADALRRRTEAGRQREIAARGTLAWWTRRFQFREEDFEPEGQRLWRRGHAVMYASWVLFAAAALSYTVTR